MAGAPTPAIAALQKAKIAHALHPYAHADGNQHSRTSLHGSLLCCEFYSGWRRCRSPCNMWSVVARVMGFKKIAFSLAALLLGVFWWLGWFGRPTRAQGNRAK